MSAHPLLTRPPVRRAALAAAAAFLFALPAAAAPFHVQLGRADDIAVDQPRAYWELHDASGNLIGPGFDLGGGVLDTGANGVLVGHEGYLTEDFDYDPAVYPIARRADNSQVQYEEIGVAGSAYFDVFTPQTLAFTTDGENQYEINNFRAFGSIDADLGGFSAVVGMPAMRGHVVTMNTASITTDVFLSTTITNTPAAPTAHSYRVPLVYLPAEHTAPLEPGDPTPDFADLPMVPNVTTASGKLTSTSTVLLDTGSQFSMISTATATALGLNLDPNSPDTDVLDSLEVGGIGGTTRIPLVLVDRLSFPTEGGKEIVLTDLLMGVIDIPTIGGIFGMNILASGQLPELLGGDGTPGYFDSVELDFRSATSATMTLNVNPLYDVARQTLNWAGTAGNTNWTSAAPNTPFVDGASLRTAFTPRDYVRFDDSAAVTTVNVSAPVTPDWVFVDNTNKSYTFTGAGKITGAARLTKSGTGSLRIETLNDYTGPTVIAGGSVTFAARQNIGDVDVRAGASASFLTSQRFATLDVGGAATLTAHGASPLKAIWTNGIKVGGKIDLTDNALAVRPVIELEQSSQDVLEQLTSLIRSGRNGGPSIWSGIGLVSSSALADPRTTLGVIINANPNGTARFATLGGETLSEQDVVVRWTFAGDADLDGAVGPSDFNLLASHFGQSDQLWSTGDFDYDGTVGPGDFNLLASNFGQALPGFTSGNLTAEDWAALEAFALTVPEPGAVALIGIVMATAACRRRRN